jgi:hypothetical protein
VRPFELTRIAPSELLTTCTVPLLEDFCAVDPLDVEPQPPPAASAEVADTAASDRIVAAVAAITALWFFMRAPLLVDLRFSA